MSTRPGLDLGSGVLQYIQSRPDEMNLWLKRGREILIVINREIVFHIISMSREHLRFKATWLTQNTKQFQLIPLTYVYNT